MNQCPVFEKPHYEVADLVAIAGDSYRQAHTLSHQQHKVLNAIANCRTAQLGGHLEQCDQCDYQQPAYNSCRNRHCPKCQGLDNIRWVQARESELLPIQYFHVVFTLPHTLNPLIQYNQAHFYTLLFKSATETLQQFAQKKWQGKLGITCVLHTWGQQLQQHVHLHCIVTGGVLRNDQERWINAPKNYLFKVENLSTVYRGKFCGKLEQSYQQGAIQNPPKSLLAASEEHLHDLIDYLLTTPWVVYSKPPFAGPTAVLKYLSRYTHRIAISNHRLQHISTTDITFSYKDYADNRCIKSKTLTHEAFLKRYLLHVLPKSYVRIRHFGLLAGRHRRAKLDCCRQLFALPPQQPRQRKTNLELLQQLNPFGLTLCPCCHQGHLHAVDLRHDPPCQSIEKVSLCAA